MWHPTGKLNPLMAVEVYGIFRPDAWDRYFLNEAFYTSFNQDQVDTAVTEAFGKFNFSNPDSRARFEKEVNRFIKKFPNTVVPEGEQFDFQRFYAQQALEADQDTSRFDANLIAELKQQLAQDVNALPAETPGDNSANRLGTRLPQFLQPKQGAALQ